MKVDVPMRTSYKYTWRNQIAAIGSYKRLDQRDKSLRVQLGQPDKFLLPHYHFSL
jgi:hypothetical protein